MSQDWHLKPFSNPAFCVLPFYGIEYPANTPCCLLKPGYNLTDVKNQMLAGIKPSSCNTCWKLEDAGITSDRQLKNQSLDFYLDRDIRGIVDDCEAGLNSIIHYKIDTSNVCNGTCVTCNSYCSSSWAQLERKHKTANVPRRWQIKTKQLNIGYATARSIGFRGGEPLLSSTNFDILENLLKHGNDSCFINFTTNGSLAITDYQKNLLRQFKHVNFCFSIDGIGPVFEYLRFPLKWDTLLENIEYCRQNGILVSTSYTVSNMNVLYHNETMSWFNKNSLEVVTNTVNSPSYFRPNALPLAVKKQMPQAFFTPHTDADDTDFARFLVEIQRQDTMKRISIAKYLPKFYTLINT